MSCCCWLCVLTERRDLGVHEEGDDASFCIEAGPIGRAGPKARGVKCVPGQVLNEAGPETGGRGVRLPSPGPGTPSAWVLC